MRAAFAAALRNERLRRGITQSEVAARIGVGQTAVAAWENAVSIPDPLTVFTVERAIGMRPGRLSRHLGYVPVPAGRA